MINKLYKHETSTNCMYTTRYYYCTPFFWHIYAISTRPIQRHRVVRDRDLPYAEKLNVAFWRGGVRPANRCGDWTAGPKKSRETGGEVWKPVGNQWKTIGKSWESRRK